MGIDIAVSDDIQTSEIIADCIFTFCGIPGIQSHILQSEVTVVLDQNPQIHIVTRHNCTIAHGNIRIPEKLEPIGLRPG